MAENEVFLLSPKGLDQEEEEEDGEIRICSPLTPSPLLSPPPPIPSTKQPGILPSLEGTNCIFQKKIIRAEIFEQKTYVQTLQKELDVVLRKRGVIKMGIAVHRKILSEYQNRMLRLEAEMDECNGAIKTEAVKLDELLDEDYALSIKEEDAKEMVGEIEKSIRNKIIRLSRNDKEEEMVAINVASFDKAMSASSSESSLTLRKSFHVSLPTKNGVIRESMEMISFFTAKIPFHSNTDVSTIAKVDDRGVEWDHHLNEGDQKANSSEKLKIDPNIYLCIDGLNGECKANLTGDCPYQHIASGDSDSDADGGKESLATTTTTTKLSTNTPRDDIIKILNIIVANAHIETPKIENQDRNESPIEEYFAFIQELDADLLISSLGIGDIVDSEYIIIDDTQVSIDKSVPFASLIPLLHPGILTRLSNKEQLHQLMERSLIHLKGNSALLVMLIYYQLLKDSNIITRIAMMIKGNDCKKTFDLRLVVCFLDSEQCLNIQRILSYPSSPLLLKTYHSLSTDQLHLALTSAAIKDEIIIWWILWDSMQNCNGFPSPSIVIPFIKRITNLSPELLDFLESFNKL